MRYLLAATVLLLAGCSSGADQAQIDALQQELSAIKAAAAKFGERHEKLSQANKALAVRVAALEAREPATVGIPRELKLDRLVVDEMVAATVSVRGLAVADENGMSRITLAVEDDDIASIYIYGDVDDLVNGAQVKVLANASGSVVTTTNGDLVDSFPQSIR